MQKLKVLTIFGTRPEIIKLAPFIKAVEADGDCISLTCATAQHREMQDGFMDIFGLNANYDLDIMRAGQDLFHITQTVLQKLQPILIDEQPDFVVVQGDTSTAFSAALGAFYSKIPIVHIEAGLRTNNISNPYPEEANRQLISRIASLHMAPTNKAVTNLANEGIKTNVFDVGNTIVDALQLVSEKAPVQTSNKVLITVHRRENFGEQLKNICQAISELANIYSDLEFIWPVHPNPNIRSFVYGNMLNLPNLKLCDPLSYVDLINLVRSCKLLISDSGGLQEEAVILGKNIIILRNETERPEVVDSGAGVLVGSDQDLIVKNFKSIISGKQNTKIKNDLYGLPGVSNRILNIIKEIWRNKR